MMNKKLLLSITMIGILILPGCWDVLDIGHRAFVTAIGIDQGSAEYPYKITLEIIKPRELFSTSEKPASIIQTVDAENISMALEKIQGRIPHQINLTHLQLVLIGETIARKENFKNFVDYFQRNPDLSYRLRLLFIKDGEATEILQSKPLLKKYMTAEIISRYRLQTIYSLDRNRSFYEFTRDLRSSKGRGLASRVIHDEDQNITIRHGSCIFKDWKLYHWLSYEETQGANWLLSKGNSTIVAHEGKSKYTYRQEKKSVKIIPEIKNDQLQFLVKINTQGTLVQQEGDHKNLSSVKDIQILESLFSDAIYQQVKAAIYKSQKEIKVDYLDFGGSLYRTKPKLYQTLDWEQVYPTIPIEIQVNAHLPLHGVGA